jgi:hypothetical protein
VPRIVARAAGNPLLPRQRAVGRYLVRHPKPAVSLLVSLAVPPKGLEYELASHIGQIRHICGSMCAQFTSQGNHTRIFHTQISGRKVDSGGIDQVLDVEIF